MLAGPVAFRCDGDERVGAGHVSRCLQIALAFEAAGVETAFAGSYSGIAAGLLDAAGMRTIAPGDLPAGAPREAAAVVVDSYEIAVPEIEALAERLPVGFISDADGLRAAAVLCYHLDAHERCPVPDGTVALLGPDYAPVRPATAAARRRRRFERLLVTVGGGTAGAHLLGEVVDAALEVDGMELFVAGTDLAPRAGAEGRVRQGIVRGGLLEEIRWADAAVTTAGSTPYDLACAGVPMLLLAIAENQTATMRGFVAAGLARGIDVQTTKAFGDALSDGLRRLGDDDERARLATAGPALVDGYGAFRARDGLAAAFAGDPLPRVLRYRPAALADAPLLLAWRNAPDVRAVSRSSDPITPEEHAAWLRGVLADPARTLLVVEEGGRPVGAVRFDETGGEAEISITVDPQRRGGTGALAIAQASELYLAAHTGVARLRAEVQSGNERSLRAFTRAGYLPAGETPTGSALVRVRRSGP